MVPPTVRTGFSDLKTLVWNSGVCIVETLGAQHADDVVDAGVVARVPTALVPLLASAMSCSLVRWATIASVVTLLLNVSAKSAASQP